MTISHYPCSTPDLVYLPSPIQCLEYRKNRISKSERYIHRQRLRVG